MLDLRTIENCFIHHVEARKKIIISKKTIKCVVKNSDKYCKVRESYSYKNQNILPTIVTFYDYFGIHL